MSSKELAVAEKNVLELVAELGLAGAVNAVSLTLDTKDPLPYDSWESLGRLLGRISNGIQWWIGDWLNFGAEVYGEESAQAVEPTRHERYDIAQRITGKAPQTLMNWSSYCTKIAKDRRRPELAFSTHTPVAPLEPDEQIAWLARAVEEEWSESDLRAALHEASNPAPTGSGSEPSDPGSGGLTLAERLEAAARLVFHHGQPQRSGDVLVPGEAWQHLAVALGEE